MVLQNRGTKVDMEIRVSLSYCMLDTYATQPKLYKHEYDTNYQTYFKLQTQTQTCIQVTDTINTSKLIELHKNSTKHK